MPQTISRLTTPSGREIILVGTAHISPESIAEVRSLIESERPARVCVEIDAGRWKSMRDGPSWESLDIVKVLKEGRGFLLLANLALSGFQRRMGSEVGVKPGEEMLAAISKAEELGIPFSLCDRDVQVTLKRAWGKSGLWNRSKLVASLAGSAFSSEKLTGEEIEKLKARNELEEMMAELADYLPSVKEVLIDERDRYLAAKIHEAWKLEGAAPAAGAARPDGGAAAEGEASGIAAKAAPILAVVGAGHLPGIEAWLGRFLAGEPGTDVAELETLPPPSPWGKLAGWAIPAAIVALIALGFFRSGTEASLAMILRWVLLNGSLAALGSAICLAHPLTILLSFLSAPLATLNPFVGVGLFAGVAEAFLKKPRVVDFERVAEDVASLRGFYTNRVTHILLVFLLSSLGGMAGNFIAIPLLASGAFGG